MGTALSEIVLNNSNSELVSGSADFFSFGVVGFPSSPHYSASDIEYFVTIIPFVDVVTPKDVRPSCDLLRGIREKVSFHSS